MNINNIAKVVLLLLIIVLIPVLLFSFIKPNKQISQTYKQDVIITTPTVKRYPSFSPSVSYIKPDNFETYTSNRYKYSFSYPKEWTAHLYDADDPRSFTGAHTIQNYDTEQIEQYMDHGLVDWENFLGDKAAININISVNNDTYSDEERYIQTIINRENEYIKASNDNVRSDLLAREEISDLSIGTIKTKKILIPISQENNINKQLYNATYVAFSKDKNIVSINLSVSNGHSMSDVKQSSDWKLVEEIFNSFIFE